ncbi:MAG TPA: sigma-70 family RNA polymerase sigma factor [Ignavibacteria bacterium]|nr:sigma-70 family RNA polymerase sigma factor [Ignavibacteria bacterium]HMR40663.1 sigma-70 family RNA polymerase sigma factor [Ignavibacteria bacterium]
MSDKKLNIASSDEELISSFNKGDQSAFNYIVRKYQKKVYWIIRKMVLDHDDADDITQEVFIKLYRSLNDFRGDSKFFTYLYKIAVNYSINHLNRNKKINSRKSDIENTIIPSEDKIADEIMISRDITDLLEEAIETLPAQQRAVFNMRYYDNLSYEDISNILNKSVGGMKANYFHAIKRLEKFLKCNKKSELTEYN